MKCKWEDISVRAQRIGSSLQGYRDDYSSIELAEVKVVNGQWQYATVKPGFDRSMPAEMTSPAPCTDEADGRAKALAALRSFLSLEEA